MKHNEKVTDRRRLFANAIRAGVLALIALGGGASLLKRRRLVRQGKCINSGICGRCDIFDDCRLPQALSKRKFDKRNG
jgi:hypothetical protein